MKNNNLNNIENYNKELTTNEHVLFLKYIGLIHELTECSVDNISIQKSDYLKYIIIKGIKNVFYIYNFLLLYTKNLELTIYHSQKAILYFIEFIGQIECDDHSSLKLNINDASLFIYKKTIFDINNDFRKTYDESEDTKQKIENLHLYIECYNSILIKIVDNFDFNTEQLKDLQKITFTKLYKIVEHLIQLPIIFKNDNILIKNKITEYNNFITTINNSYHLSVINKNYLQLIPFFIKKGYKTNIDNIKIKNKLINNDIDIGNILEKYSVCKIYNYLIS